MSGPPSPPHDGEDFGSAAVRLAGVTALALGWSPDRFWRATPAEVATVVAALAPAGERPLDGAALERLREAMGDG